MIRRGSRRYLAQQIRRALARVASPVIRTDLPTLARVHGTDKWGRHAHALHYQHHFEPLRKKKIRLLEIGVGGHKARRLGGASLRMWKAYFVKGTIIGLDIYDKTQLIEDRIKIIQGDQGDPNSLTSAGDNYGPFDIIIDDGSHRNDHVIGTFRSLFPYLKSGGLYAVEDTQTSYWPRFGGDPTNLTRSDTTLGYFKGLVDALNWMERDIDNYEPSYLERNIIAAHYYHNLAIFEKGVNEAAGGDPLHQ